jgi:hypothetical protein
MLPSREARLWGWGLVALTFLGMGSVAAGEPPEPKRNGITLGFQEDASPASEAPSLEFQLAPRDPPLGYTGPSGVLPRSDQWSPPFVPIEDRWRIGFPPWDRYGKDHPLQDDYPYVPGRRWDPFNQNVLKGDFPILGQNTFLELTATSFTVLEVRQVPTATTPFESTANPFQSEFFGKPGAVLFSQYLRLSTDLFHGDASFKPVDWRIKLTPIVNANYLAADELAVVSPDVRNGTDRGRSFVALEEAFVEGKLADLSPDYDFVSVRAGTQPFTSDFRGFLFSDVNRAVRVFGTLEANRDQFNLIAFDMLEKDTNSGLNTFQDRGQYIFIGNFYRQDFLFPGYTAQCSVTYNYDQPSFHFDKNNFLVRPDPVGVFQPHRLNVVYLGWTGDGHIDRYNITHAFYWALGHDSLNPLANQKQDINAQMAAVELSYDRDWTRFRASFFWASGDSNINNSHATGFDSIFDNPNFAGGEFSFWQRQAIPLFGINLVNRNSIVPDMRSSKIQGQSNFVNPGLLLFNLGVDFDVTPKLKLVNNVNFLWFDETNVLDQFTFDGHIHYAIGTDLSTGVVYRPLLSNNVVVNFGVSGFIPGLGFEDLYSKFGSKARPLGASFLELNLTF